MAPGLRIAWRFAVLGGLTAGLALSPYARPAPWPAPVLAALAATVVLAVTAPAAAARGRAMAWIASLALSASVLGLAAGDARLRSIDAGALDLAAGSRVAVRGHVIGVPTRSQGEVTVRLETAEGRLLVSAPEPVGDLPVGAAVQVTGVIRDPAAWERPRLERLGIRDLLAARRIERFPGRRDGVTGLLDAIRARAESALGRGTTPAAASLLRGFVLGQDDRIDDPTVDEFKASGLAHLLAVSGQNVVLLALLAAALLAVLDVPLRARLAWILVVIAVYVPVAGAGASIQRAGVMGAAGVIAALAGRPRSRWYALLLAACATLALDPRASADVGWQLSFAAVVGILLLTAPITGLLAPGAAGGRRVLAEGLALTVAATLATAPLMAHHFGALSVVAVPANLLALPAVAPVMWLGMLAGAVGQLEWLPVEPLTWLAGLLAAYVAQVAAWFAAPDWAQARIDLDGPLELAAAYVALGALTALGLRWAGRRRGLQGPHRRTPRLRRAAGIVALASLTLVAVAGAGLAGRGDSEGASNPGLRVTVLDVGQGDSILLEPAGADPVLVDAGPAEAVVAEQLAARGVERLAAVVITHPQADHDGGVAEVLERLPTERLVFAQAMRASVAAAEAAGVDPLRVSAGARMRSGGLRLEVLWPSAERLRDGSLPGADPNLLSLVALARWRGFELLLTGDAEAEAAPVDPGRIDVLKVAHHGSEDAGLGSLLERAEPRLALISVGDTNPFGHPTARTTGELASAGVPVLRTDIEGEIVLEADETGWRIAE